MGCLRSLSRSDPLPRLKICLQTIILKAIKNRTEPQMDPEAAFLVHDCEDSYILYHTSMTKPSLTEWINEWLDCHCTVKCNNTCKANWPGFCRCPKRDKQVWPWVWADPLGVFQVPSDVWHQFYSPWSNGGHGICDCDYRLDHVIGIIWTALGWLKTGLLPFIKTWASSFQLWLNRCQELAKAITILPNWLLFNGCP